MNFDDFSDRISKIENLPLPGRASHYKMTPLMRIRELESEALIKKNPKQAAVMALFYPSLKNEANLLLILRNTYKGVHSAQIALPGGKLEKGDANLLATALRETQEEVGAVPERIKVIKTLSEIYIPPSNFEVQPYLGLYRKEQPFLLQAEEVAALVEVSVTDFMDDSKVVQRRITTSYAQNIPVPAFNFMGYTVWGATAMMLSEIKELLKQVL
ncbi:NUDIX domain-containing protein [Arenibacter nanhaiticus]|uniref:NUDIX domain-containing protein n=1 Tax=Arenibacter nanhaiticus TaxID=558155 RepID=A0A1M6B7Q4_9FLAO|nr:CoA pyrophosphatase [Arenibacter nanhaiticus]SHI44608.1 NUDIX domain-containing protein [Arenibacter nanhaiticus]